MAAYLYGRLCLQTPKPRSPSPWAGSFPTEIILARSQSDTCSEYHAMFLPNKRSISFHICLASYHRQQSPCETRTPLLVCEARHHFVGNVHPRPEPQVLGNYYKNLFSSSAEAAFGDVTPVSGLVVISSVSMGQGNNSLNSHVRQSCTPGRHDDAFESLLNILRKT